jgi:hypothetical protein
MMATDKKYNDKTTKVLKPLHDTKKPIDKNGIPIHVMNVPGVSRSAGTPGWVSGPAKSAARKAK